MTDETPADPAVRGALLIERHPEWVGREWIERGVGCLCTEHAG